MSANSKIEWTDATWNPIAGCSKVSPGCKHCYAINHVHRMAGNPNPKIAAANAGLTVLDGHHMAPNGGTYKPQGGKVNWTGEVRLIPDRLEIPLRRRIPTRYFVNSLSDLFHEGLEFKDINKVWLTMQVCPQHTFQVLTKRSARMQEFVRWAFRGTDAQAHAERSSSHIWLGVSVESRDYLHRIDDLRRTPAAVRFLSLEPLLEDLGDISKYLMDKCPECGRYWKRGWRDCPNPKACDGRPSGGIDWVIVGGESGPEARPMHPDWVRSIRDQCVAAGVPLFFKQWGEWRDRRLSDGDPQHPCIRLTWKGRSGIDLANIEDGGDTWMERFGKKAAGRLLDGRTWDEMPSTPSSSQR